MKLYGLKQCDTCRKALKELCDRAEFVAIDDPAPSSEMIEEWLAVAGQKMLLNVRSTTWRALSDAEKAKADTSDGLVALLEANPKLIKRPVIVSGDTITVGWAADVKAKYL